MNSKSQEQKDVDSDKDKLVLLGSNVTGSVYGSLLGLAIGGPVGAVVGATSGPLVAFAVNAIARRQDRAQRTLNKAAMYAGENPEVFVEKLTQNDQAVDLTVKILSLAAESQFDEKVNILGALLADVYQKNNDKLEQQLTLIRIIDALDPVHLKVLEFIKNCNSEKSELPGCPPDDIIKAFSDSSFLIRSIVRTLELHGLILDATRLAPGQFEGKVFWIISELGETLLKIIKTCSMEEAENKLLKK